MAAARDAGARDAGVRDGVAHDAGMRDALVRDQAVVVTFEFPNGRMNVSVDKRWLEFRLADGSLLEAQLHGPIVSEVLEASVDMEARLAGAAAQIVAPMAPGTLVAAFVPAAEVLGYAVDDPTGWPGPFFTTLSGYAPRVTPPAHHADH